MSNNIFERPDIIAARTVQSIVGIEGFAMIISYLPPSFFDLADQDKFIFWFEVLRELNKGKTEIKVRALIKKIYPIETPEFPNGEFDNGRHWKGKNP